VVAVIGGLFWLQRWNYEHGFAPAFSGMSAEDAGAVTAHLRESNTEYRLADGGSTILVRAESVPEVRLQLAAAGLPQTGRLGFELFDQANFGASEFTEQVNYHRAMEGELERSVMSLREVERARVHISMAKDSLYLESRQAAKASILIQLRRGAQLSAQNIAAIVQLAASAVPGLQANQVTLLDTAGNLLNRARPSGLESAGEASEAVLEYRKGIERDIQAKVAQTLEPLLGADHFRVGVSIDIDLTSAELSEETFDPDKSVMVSSQTTQDLPGTASNLPRATASQASAAASVTNYGRRTENTTYQTSRVVKHTKLGQGALKKVSLSILVDHDLRYDQGQPVVETPKPEKLQTIRTLVSAAVGIDINRGDQLVVEAFPFEATLAARPLDDIPPAAGAPVSGLPLPPWLQKLIGESNTIVLASAAGGVLVVLLAGAFFLWRRSRKKKPGGVSTGKQLGSPTNEAERQLEARFAEQAAEQQRQEAEAMLSLKLPAVSTKKSDVLVKHIASEVKKDPAALAHVVRSWLNGEYQR
jgi:flagellar M-ring protein FliF